MLKTFIGLSLGPAPLHQLHNFMVHNFMRLFKGAARRELTPLECHNLVCCIGQVEAVGGVRRCATLAT
jgi:ribonucleoside-triphosphate reductase (thioredoxin)